MIWYILILLLITLLTWLLLGPVILSLNTDQSLYKLKLPGVFSARVIPTDSFFYLRFRIFFIPFKFDPINRRKKSKKKEGTEEKKSKKSKKRRANLKSLKHAPAAFQVRRLCVDLDTEDFIMNAWLIPLFSSLNEKKNLQLQVNFEGRLFLDLDLRTRMGSLLWILVKYR